MNWLTRFRVWCARPVVDELNRVVAMRQREAYDLGVAHGQFLGRNQLLLEFQKMLEERRACEVDERDLARARRLH